MKNNGVNDNNNGLFFGIVILLLGICFLGRNFDVFNYNGIGVGILGIFLLFLYKTKKKSWSLVLGSYLSYFGILNFLNSIFYFTNSWIISGSGFFLVPGIVFIIMYFQKDRKALLVPGSFLLWWGISIILIRNSYFYLGRSDVLYICLGMAFLTVYFLSRDDNKDWAKYVGIFIIGVQLIRCFFLRYVQYLSFAWIFNTTWFFWPLFMIVVGLFLIIKNYRRQ